MTKLISNEATSRKKLLGLRLRLRRGARSHATRREVRFTDLRLEPLEDRALLDAVGALGHFLRTDGSASGDVEAEAYVVNGFAIDGEYSDQQDLLIHIGATAIADDEFGFAFAHAEGTALVPTPIDPPGTIPVPQVTDAFTVELTALGTARAESAQLSSEETNNVRAVGIYEYHPDPEFIGDLIYHGHLFIAAYGDDFHSEGADTDVHSTVTSWQDENFISATTNDGNTWNVQIRVPGLELDYESIGGVNLHVHYITQDIPINFGTSISEASFAEANGPGAYAHVLWNMAGGSWGFVTGQGGVTPGDFDYDGDVDEDDFRLWLEGDPQADTDPTGTGNGYDEVIDEDDLQVWAENTDILLVTTDDDENDLDYSFGDLSLREAIALAADSNHVGPDKILFAPWVNEILLSSELSISSGNDLEVIGPGIESLTVDAQGSSRVFNIGGNVAVTISGMTITGGGDVDAGAGIYSVGDLTLDSVGITANETVGLTSGFDGGGGIISQGSLRIYNSRIDNNKARWGAGIFYTAADANSVLEIENSTIYQNDALDQGGGGLAGGLSVKSYSDQAELSLINTTVSGNTAADSAGIRVGWEAQLSIINSTITQNEATWGVNGGIMVVDAAAAVVLHNSIVAANIDTNGTGHRDIVTWGGTYQGSSYNLIGLGGNSGIQNGTAGNIVGTSSPIDPHLLPLGDYGGPNWTHALKGTSPALDAGSDSIAPDFDQRGYERPFDLPKTNGTGGSSDIGAFEANNLTLTVRTADDRLNSTLSFSDLSLREALRMSDLLAGTETINFDPALYEHGPATIYLTYDSPDFGSVADSLSIGDVTIAGPGAKFLTIHGSGQNSVFQQGGSFAEIQGITITNGSGAYGGAIASFGDLTIRASRITGNTATVAGGGIFSSPAEMYGFRPSLRIIDSEVADNTVTGDSGNGAGIAFYQLWDSGTLEVINSTISGNHATGEYGRGGGVFANLYYGPFGSEDFSHIINSTISGNSATDGGGLYLANQYVDTNPLEVHNTIIAENTGLSGAGPDDVGGSNVDGASSYNLIGRGGSGGILDNDQGNIVLSGSETAGLLPLQYNGNFSVHTRTHALHYNSPAIDKGDNNVAISFELDHDQRGENYDRIEDWDGLGGETVDIGAMELAISEFYGQ
jgi:hypothetical protein